MHHATLTATTFSVFLSVDYLDIVPSPTHTESLFFMLVPALVTDVLI